MEFFPCVFFVFPGFHFCRCTSLFGTHLDFLCQSCMIGVDLKQQSGNSQYHGSAMRKCTNACRLLDFLSGIIADDPAPAHALSQFLSVPQHASIFDIFWNGFGRQSRQSRANAFLDRQQRNKGKYRNAFQRAINCVKCSVKKRV